MAVGIDRVRADYAGTPVLINGRCSYADAIVDR